MVLINNLYSTNLVGAFLVILTPVYFYALVWAVWLNPLTTLNLNSIINLDFYSLPFGFSFSTFFTLFVAPILLCSPWIIFFVFYKNKVANSFEVMTESISVIPTRWRIFYAVNGMLVIFTFLIPVISPIFVILIAAVLAWAVIRASEFAWERSKAFLVLYSLIIFAIFCSLPILFLLEFIKNMPNFFFVIVLDIWLRYMPYFYTLTIIIANALSIGSVFWLIYAGAVEYERQELRGVGFTEIPYRKIRALEYILFFGFLVFWIVILATDFYGTALASPELLLISQSLDLILSIYTTIALIAGLLVTVIASVKGLQKSENRAPILGYFFGVFFVLMEVVRMGIDYVPSLFVLFGVTVDIIQGGLIISAGIIFLIIFLISFIRAEDEDDDFY